MADKKQSITISIPTNITQEKINEIRRIFKDQYGESYKLNIIIGGQEDMANVLKNIVIAKFKSI